MRYGLHVDTLQAEPFLMVQCTYVWIKRKEIKEALLAGWPVEPEKNFEKQFTINNWFML